MPKEKPNSNSSERRVFFTIEDGAREWDSFPVNLKPLNDKSHLSLGEIATIFNMENKTILAWLEDGQIDGLKLGDIWTTTRLAVETHLRSKEKKDYPTSR